MIADLLATKGVKKAQAQRSMENLATAGKLRAKVGKISADLDECYIVAVSGLRRYLAVSTGVWQIEDILPRAQCSCHEQGGAKMHFDSLRF